MHFRKNNFAQGTIEYLVIMAVVVVIALIVVALFIGVSSPPSQQISDSSSKIGEVAVGGISIVESVVDSNGDSLIFLSNNSSDSITLKKISSGGVELEYDEQLVGLDSKVFGLSGLDSSCPCLSGQKSVKCEFKIEYLTGGGITQTEYRTISVQCVTDSVALNPSFVVQPIVDEVVFEDGSLENPWIVNDCVELQAISEHLDGNYVLGNNIDCTNTVTWNFDGDTGFYLGFIPIGVYIESPFMGLLDGADYNILGIYLNRSEEENVGLFSHSMGHIKDMSLVDANIVGYNSVGGFVGFNQGGRLENLSFESSSNILGYKNVGGLAGMSENGEIINSSNKGYVDYFNPSEGQNSSAIGGF